MRHFDYEKVFSLKEAFDAVSASRGASVFMAGGTDLLVSMKGPSALLRMHLSSQSHTYGSHDSLLHSLTNLHHTDHSFLLSL